MFAPTFAPAVVVSAFVLACSGSIKGDGAPVKTSAGGGQGTASSGEVQPNSGAGGNSVASHAGSSATGRGAAGNAVAGSWGAAFDVKAQLLQSAASEASEAAPSGVPASFNWVAAATATDTSPPDAAHTHANYWGAVFRGLSDQTPVNTYIELRNCSMWFLYEAGSDWEKANSAADLGGSTFTPTYASRGPEPLLQQNLLGGMNLVPAQGHIFHFWQGNGYQLVARPVREVVANCQSRLALRERSVVDDRASADFLIHMGVDWRDPSDPACANDAYVCPSWGVSRLERITAGWRNHTFHSLTRAEIVATVRLPPASLFLPPAT